jgi:hypothetical protein
MQRQCTGCWRPFTPADFVKEDSKEMEADRKVLGLEGVRFLYYRCPYCGLDAIFIDLIRRAGESSDDFHDRRAGLESAVRQVHSENVGVVLTERVPVGVA